MSFATNGLCGSGAVMDGLRSRAVPVFGLESAKAAITRCRSKGLEVERFDLESDVARDTSAPLVLSTEVPGHLLEHCGDRYVELMKNISGVWIVMTAAVPGQGGTDHVNEQPNEYWIETLEVRGFVHRADLTARLRRDWAKRGVDRHRSSNVLVFERHAPASQGS